MFKISQIKLFFKKNNKEILLALIVFLLCLLSFGIGMLVEFCREKPPLKIIQSTDFQIDSQK